MHGSEAESLSEKFLTCQKVWYTGSQSGDQANKSGKEKTNESVDLNTKLRSLTPGITQRNNARMLDTED